MGFIFSIILGWCERQVGRNDLERQRMVGARLGVHWPFVGPSLELWCIKSEQRLAAANYAISVECEDSAIPPIFEAGRRDGFFRMPFQPGFGEIEEVCSSPSLGGIVPTYSKGTAEFLGYRVFPGKRDVLERGISLTKDNY